MLTENHHTCTGNHTFAAINAQENYDTLSSEMNDIMKSINDLIATPEINISDEIYTLDIIMGSDYKVNGHVCILLMPTTALRFSVCVCVCVCILCACVCM